MGWPGLKIAVACRLHAEARRSLRFGRIDPSDCDPHDLLAVANDPSLTALGSPPVCPMTLALVKEARAPWSIETHKLHHLRFREAVGVLMLIARRGPVRFPVLPGEMWLKLVSFLLRRDWPAPPAKRTPRLRRRPVLQPVVSSTPPTVLQPPAAADDQPASGKINHFRPPVHPS